MTINLPKGYRVAIFGGASGIGAAAAVYVRSQGAHVAVLDITEGDHAARHCDWYGMVDVRSEESVVKATTGALDALGGFDAVINCVGITGQTNLKTHEVPVGDFMNVVAINLTGAFLISRTVIPALLEGGHGRLLHLASIAGKEGNAGMAAYSATKAGLIGMIKVMGKEYAQSRLTVNGLAPAVIQTPLVEKMPEAQVSYMTSKIPMNRLGTVGEAAAMSTWIISPECSFTTGFTFDLSGGRAVY